MQHEKDKIWIVRYIIMHHNFHHCIQVRWCCCAVIWNKKYKRARLDSGGLVLFLNAFEENYSFFPCKKESFSWICPYEKERRDKLRWVRYNKAYLPHPLGKRPYKNGYISVFFNFLHEMMWLFRKDRFHSPGMVMCHLSIFGFYLSNYSL